MVDSGLQEVKIVVMEEAVLLGKKLPKWKFLLMNGIQRGGRWFTLVYIVWQVLAVKA